MDEKLELVEDTIVYAIKSIVGAMHSNRISTQEVMGLFLLRVISCAESHTFTGNKQNGKTVDIATVKKEINRERQNSKILSSTNCSKWSKAKTFVCQKA